MSNTQLRQDCCGDRYACDTEFRCKCGCGLCYCRSCYQEHCLTAVAKLEQLLADQRRAKLATLKGACVRAANLPVTSKHGYAGDNAKAWVYGWEYCNDFLRDPDVKAIDVSAVLADASQPGHISTAVSEIVAALHQYAAHRLDEAAKILWDYRALLSADYDQKERTDLQHLYGLIKAKAEKEAKG